MAEASDLTQQLLRRQNTDGGWGYQGVTSWTEPTALAVLALEALQFQGPIFARGHQWLLNHQRQDGGWGPNPTVSQSTSVTSTACLAISGIVLADSHARAVRWILEQIKPGLGPVDWLEFWLEGMPPAEAVMGGSPWYPGTAAWIAPTAMSVFALEDARKRPDAVLDHAAQRGKEYILSRQCPDGGWNHGGTQFRSAAASSYPEMTGMALLALNGIESSRLSASVRLAERLQQQAESSEGQSWLTLGLWKHAHAAATTITPIPPRTTRDIALRVLAISVDSPSNKFLPGTA
jgi:hypothetical protein